MRAALLLLVALAALTAAAAARTSGDDTSTSGAVLPRSDDARFSQDSGGRGAGAERGGQGREAERGRRGAEGDGQERRSGRDRAQAGRRGEFGGAPLALPEGTPRPVGEPWDGRLVHGMRIPAEGPLFFTWDPVLERSPNRSWRRYGTARLLLTLDRVLRRYHQRDPEAPRVAIGDLSRPRGGDFGARFGGLGHASHQNGLDADVYYPRRDRRERAPRSVEQVDRRLAQELVDLFVAAGAEKVFVGPRTGLRGPSDVVQPLVHHDDHLHVRIR